MHFIIKINFLSFQKRNNLKKIVDLLCAKGIFLKSLDEIDLAILKTRKKIKVFSGITDKRYFIVIFTINQKSRFIVKNAKEIIELENRLEVVRNHAYKKKYMVLESPLCSRAKAFLTKENWKILE